MIGKMSQFVFKGIEELCGGGGQCHDHHRFVCSLVGIGDTGVELAALHRAPGAGDRFRRAGYFDQRLAYTVGVVACRSQIVLHMPLAPADIQISDFQDVYKRQQRLCADRTYSVPRQ